VVQHGALVLEDSASIKRRRMYMLTASAEYTSFATNQRRFPHHVVFLRLEVQYSALKFNGM
jgi:hypothetical protein